MNIDELEPPRSFCVGVSGITLQHCADVRLEPDEMVTFITPEGSEYDVVRKSWGYYATPSLQNRILKNGFRAALAQNKNTKDKFIVLVQENHLLDWSEYAARENLVVLAWLSDAEPAPNMERK